MYVSPPAMVFVVPSKSILNRVYIEGREEDIFGREES